ncbi:MAG: hypothetical protein CM15mP120_03520 [Pseudomonadota bacterium]|nr:MAG: hypothetical protein CM15mP120_03520 [Pseudomonadota bacterium]
MEEQLDKVAHGEALWNQVLDNFYSDFSSKLDQAQALEGGMRPNAQRIRISNAQPVAGRCKFATALLVSFRLLRLWVET